jgi:hypothetical protein
LVFMPYLAPLRLQDHGHLSTWHPVLYFLFLDGVDDINET